MSIAAPATEKGRGMARFMAVLTHAIRGRLNAVLGSLELVSQTRLSDDQSRFVETAVDEGRALLQLVNDALDLARIDAGELRLEDTPLDPVAIAEGALGTVAARLHQRGIAVACQIDPQTPLTLRGDGARLRQILVNLLDNARKATESGSVTLHVHALPSEQGAGERLVFEVTDTGRGLADGLRERLFEPLVPSSGPADLRATSLGIGLALCRRLVELMGGRIEYAPRPGGGSVFRFGVQMRRDVEFERFTEVFAEARGRRVLLVDGDPVRSSSLGKQLQGCGIDTVIEADGVVAACRLPGGPKPYDLLLVQQDVAGAAELLQSAGMLRCAVLFPIGVPPRQELICRTQDILWLSTPVRRRTLTDALLGRMLPSTEVPDIRTGTGQKRARVLVVEDSDANRLVMGARLERLGCTVDAVDTGSEAIRKVSERHYALVLADLCLPDMSGLEVAASIRQLGGAAGRVPIIAVTGGTHPRDRERCLAAGMNDYLCKPLEQRDLVRILQRFLPKPVEDDGWSAASIESMIQDLGPERSADLLSAFERELGQRLARIGPEAQLEQVGHEAHALKSTALAFGAARLGEMAQRVEAWCRKGQLPDARRGAVELQILGRGVQAAVQGWLDQQRESQS